MRSIFLSYSDLDAEIVDRVVARLDAEGFSISGHRSDTVTGSEWRDEVVNKIDACSNVPNEL
jgi:hypothetical protein